MSGGSPDSGRREGGGADDEAEVTLTVPAHVEYLDVVRTVVARQARRLGFSFDAIEDVCVAVDEACALLLSNTEGAGELMLEVREGSAADGRSLLTVTATSSGHATPWPPDAFEEDLGWQLLQALAEEVEMLLCAKGPAIRIRQPER